MRKIIKKITNTLRGISNFLRKTSIKNRLIASFSVGIIFCSSILGILLYKKATNALKNNAINYSENMLSIMSVDIYKNKEFLERASIELSMNEEIANNLINYKFMDGKEKNEFLKYMNDYLSKKLSLLPNLAEVEIISKDYEVTYMQGFKYFKREDIERYADESENGLFWFSTILNNEPHICIVTPVKQDNSIVGYVFMAIKSEVFASSFSPFTTILLAVSLAPLSLRNLFKSVSSNIKLLFKLFSEIIMLFLSSIIKISLPLPILKREKDILFGLLFLL